MVVRAVRVECRPHRGEEISAPPDARIHGERDGDAELAQMPGWRVALARARLALAGDGGVSARRGDALVRVVRKGGGVNADRGGIQEPVLGHQPDAVIVGGAPHSGVSRHGKAEVARGFEGAVFRKGGVTGDIEGKLHAQHIAAPVNAPLDEVGELRLSASIPRARPASCRRRARTVRESPRARQPPPRHAGSSGGHATSQPMS